MVICNIIIIRFRRKVFNKKYFYTHINIRNVVILLNFIWRQGPCCPLPIATIRDKMLYLARKGRSKTQNCRSWYFFTLKIEKTNWRYSTSMLRVDNVRIRRNVEDSHQKYKQRSKKNGTINSINRSATCEWECHLYTRKKKSNSVLRYYLFTLLSGNKIYHQTV